MKRSIELSFNTIVIAILSIAILGILTYVFVHYTGKGTSALGEQLSSQDESSSQAGLYYSCKIYLDTGDSSNWQDKKCYQFKDLLSLCESRGYTWCEGTSSTSSGSAEGPVIPKGGDVPT